MSAFLCICVSAFFCAFGIVSFGVKISTGAILIITAYAASAASSYAAALSTLYASRPRILLVNIFTALTFVPMAALKIMPLPQFESHPVVVPFIIALSLAQMVLRLVHSICVTRYAEGD